MSNTGNPFTSTSNHKENNHVMISRGGEKKVMKKILSVALSTAMAFSMFASVAFGQTGLTDVNAQYNYLKDKGIFSGFPDGQAHLDRQMTRAEFAKVITKTLGLKEVEGVYSFKDKNYGENHWAAPYVEAVYAAGIMEGVNSTKKIFGVSNPVTIQEMATVLVRALDLEVPTETNNSATAWAKGYVQAAINAGLVDANANFQSNATRELLVGAAYAVDQELSLSVESYTVSEAGKVVEFKMTDGETVKVTLDKALEANKETEVKFTYQEKEFTEKVTYVVTAATKVEAATATNLKEVVVTFDGQVDKATAEKADNYTLGTGTVDSASLSEDAKTVTLTLTGAIANQTENTLSVSGVKAGDKTISVKDFKFTPVDNALPEVAAVKNLGTKAVKVVFTEPVKEAPISSFKLDGKTFYGSVDISNREVVLTPYDNSLTVGDHTLTVSNVVDYSGLKSLSSDTKFTVVADTTAPTIAKVEATLETATVTFSEEVDPSTVAASNVYWTNGSTKYYASSVTKVASDKYSFDFSGNKLPAYETTFYVEGVKDYSGNQITETSTKVNATVDQTRPEVKEVKAASDALSFVVTYNKKVGSTATEASRYVVTDKDGKVINVSNVAFTDASQTAVRVTLYNTLTSGTNTVKITGVKDATALENTLLDYSTSIVLGDTTPPTLGAEATNATTRTVVIPFSENMDPASLSDRSNYLIHFNGVLRTLPANVEIQVVQGTKAVLLTFPASIDGTAVTFGGTLDEVRVLGVKDAAGNILSNYTAGTNTIIISATDAAALARYSTTYDSNYKAALNDTRTIVVKFNKGIASASVNDFQVNGGTVGIQSVTPSADGTVTIKTTSDVTSAPSIDVLATNSLRTVAGGSVTADSIASTDVLDFTAPTVVSTATSYAVGGTAAAPTITVPFNKALASLNTLGDVANDLIVKRLSDNTILTPIVDYTTTISETNVVIALTNGNADSSYTVEVKSPTYLVDTVANTLADGTTTKPNKAATKSALPTDKKIDSVAPALVSAVATNATTVVVTLSENVKTTGTATPAAIAAQFTVDNDDAAGTPAVAATSAVVSGKTVTLTFAAGTFTSAQDIGAVTYTAAVGNEALIDYSTYANPVASGTIADADTTTNF
ncbi:S-layer homology domain-containing protein [Paenibacillus urinalis]|uniref:S-layer homology domain-containing protein n=1 Tax=Paenibacillus urinalis TaxID=521520 RepID=A0AAX3MXB5_9BACL|nr:S-layer homology domain-containing protein [Paenibacillus urinalis]WDH82270.1 S-layer homology domain-containing protein [Paenibacillus urinalis]